MSAPRSDHRTVRRITDSETNQVARAMFATRSQRIVLVCTAETYTTVAAPEPGLSNRCVVAPSAASIRADDPTEALGVPGHRAPDARGAHRQSLERRSDVPAAGRRQILADQAIPTVDTLDVHRRRPAVVRPAMGRAGRLARRLRRSRAGQVWSSCAPGSCALIFGCLFLVGPRAGLPNRYAASLTLAAFTVAAPGACPPAPARRDGAVRRRAVDRADRRADTREPCGSSRLLVAVWANVHGSFFLGPLVLGLDLAGGPARPSRAATSAPRRDDRERRDRVPDAVRSGRLGLCGRAVDRTRGHGADHRVAARRRCATSPGSCSSARPSRSVVVARPAAAARGGFADAPVAGRLPRHRDLRGPGHRLVGAGGRAGRGNAPCGRALAQSRESGDACHATRQRGRGAGDGRRGRRPAARLEAGRSTHRHTRRAREDTCAARRHVGSERHSAGGGPPVRPQPGGSWVEFALPDLLVTVDSRVELFPADGLGRRPGLSDPARPIGVHPRAVGGHPRGARAGPRAPCRHGLSRRAGRRCRRMPAARCFVEAPDRQPGRHRRAGRHRARQTVARLDHEIAQVTDRVVAGLDERVERLRAGHAGCRSSIRAGPPSRDRG